jgi:hypothetical protein
MIWAPCFGQFGKRRVDPGQALVDEASLHNVHRAGTLSKPATTQHKGKAAPTESKRYFESRLEVQGGGFA